jgi:hypothetical protein
MTVAAMMAMAATPAAAEEAGPGTAFTLGLVQKELREGQSEAEVVEKLGSPNILTRDGRGRQAWVYDRVSVETETTSSGFSIGGGGIGSNASLVGALGARGGRQRAKSVTSQRTLTVVIRFSPAGQVETFSWHDSRF